MVPVSQIVIRYTEVTLQISLEYKILFLFTSKISSETLQFQCISPNFTAEEAFIQTQKQIFHYLYTLIF